MSPLQDSVAYNTYTSYFSLDSGTYYIDFKSSETGEFIKTFIINVTNDFIGRSMTMFLNGTLEDEGDVRLWGLWPDGTLIEFESLSYSRIQLIHNSRTDSVDVYFNQRGTSTGTSAPPRRPTATTARRTR